VVHIQWKDRYNINFREIDAQHHGLLDLLNELSDLMDGRPRPDHVRQIFRALCDYAQTHFSSEERYMQAAGYPKLAQHRQEHAFFVARVLELSQAFDPGDHKVVEETLAFVKDWYLDHITKSDQDYAPFLRRALPTASTEGVLLGLQGVICTWDPAPLIDLVSSIGGKTAQEVREALLEDPGFLRGLESGQLDPGQFHAELSTWTGAALPLDDLARSYTSALRPVPAMVQLASRLKIHQPVAVVGDAPPWMRTLGLAHLGIVGLFSAEAFSFEVGVRLPDKALLQAAVTKLGLPPESCLLIHRDPTCLDAAQAAQLQTLHYTNPVMLMAELRRMGVPF
jgi:hemerythrin